MLTDLSEMLLHDPPDERVHDGSPHMGVAGVPGAIVQGAAPVICQSMPGVARELIPTCAPQHPVGQ
jgi:hypothetical protein